MSFAIFIKLITYFVSVVVFSGGFGGMVAAFALPPRRMVICFAAGLALALAAAGLFHSAYQW